MNEQCLKCGLASSMDAAPFYGNSDKCARCGHPKITIESNAK